MTVARTWVPSLKVTVPAGVPENCGETVAVNVTDCPADDGFCEDTRAVVVEALLTTWLRAAELLAAYVVSPL